MKSSNRSTSVNMPSTGADTRSVAPDGARKAIPKFSPPMSSSASPSDSVSPCCGMADMVTLPRRRTPGRPYCGSGRAHVQRGTPERERRDESTARSVSRLSPSGASVATATAVAVADATGQEKDDEDDEQD